MIGPTKAATASEQEGRIVCELRSPATCAALGMLLGAAGGLCNALGDFGATWLWIPWWSDRLDFLWKVLALQVPLGALLGAALALVIALGDRYAAVVRPSLRRWVRPLPLLVVAAPALLFLASYLFRGGMMSRLPAQPVLKTLASIAALGSLYGAALVGRPALRWALSNGRGRRLAAGGALLGAHFVAMKVDQVVLPKLYDYLHAALAVGAWFLAAVGVGLLASGTRVGRVLEGRRPLLFALALVGALAFTLTSLPKNPNVRVTLFDARAASSRSLLLGLDPLLQQTLMAKASAAAIDAARQARASRETASADDSLPTWLDAHVLLVTIDALRPDHLGTYGYGRGLSPRIDAFAQEAVVFERAYAQAPHSSYSIASFMVSQYLHETVELGQPLPSDTFATVLAREGFHTAAYFTLGIFHTEGERLLAYQDNAFGFARHEHTDLPAEAQTDRLLDEVDRIVGAGEPPSLLWMHYFDVHEPYKDTSLGTSDIDRYDGEIRNVDRAFGRLLDELRARLHKDLIVVLSADHGEEFREHGGVYHGSTLYDEQIRIPLLIGAPRMAPRRVERPVEAVDVVPTVLSMLGVARPKTMRGNDLRPLLMGQAVDPGPAFSAVGDKRMVLRWPYKLIADFRYSLFEVYNLEKDPGERVNLASDKKLVDSLRGEMFALLDTLQRDVAADPLQLALERGRLGDRRGIADLGRLLNDRSAPVALRREAARLLGGLVGPKSNAPLVAALQADDALVAAEAAIGLGRHGDPRAHDLLVRLVVTEDPNLRARAALALGRLGDRRAVPGLLQTLRGAKEAVDREEAVHLLGLLRDPSAVEPLIELLSEFRVRHLTVLALGEIGDRRAYEPLVRVLDWETHARVRDNVVRALGQLGDRRALPALMRLTTREPELTQLREALVRLGAIDTGAIGGADLSATLGGKEGFDRCEESPLHREWDFLDRTWCRTSANRASFPIRSMKEGLPSEATLRLRRADATAPIEVRVRIGSRVLKPQRVDGQWIELRWPLDTAPTEPNPTVTIETTDPQARLDLDHFLVLPARTPSSS